MKVVVGIPWRETPGRRPHLDVLLEFYRTHLPDWEIRFGDSGHEPFNRAATRNLLVEQAHDADVVVLNDADTFVHPHTLAFAAREALAGGLHYPFTFCLNHAPEDMAADLLLLRFPHRGGYRATGGVYVVRPDVWWSFGGQDERFRGWGGEDDATFIAASTLARVVRHRGVAVGLRHDAVRKAECPFWEQAGEHMDRYRAARGNPTEMRNLVAGNKGAF